MNPKAGEVDTNERANGTQASDIEPRNTLLPSKPWIPEKQRLTNREALDILEQKRAERGAKIASGTFCVLVCACVRMCALMRLWIYELERVSVWTRAHGRRRRFSGRLLGES